MECVMPVWPGYSFALLGLLSAGPAMAQDISVETSRVGELIMIEAAADLPVSVRAAWDVLTDYDHLADFIPDMKSSRVLSRGSEGVKVEQKGEFSFLFLSRTVDVTLMVTESPPVRVASRAIAGSFRELSGSYQLEPLAHGMRLRYSGRMIPDFDMPPLFGMLAVRAVAEKRFSAMAREIMRRAQPVR
jgi:ribosome-associated toxin RatA of RatAB toxin-antitoxin module